jgi:hypothetical protein
MKKDALRSDWFHWTLPQIHSLADCSSSMRSSHTKPTEGSISISALSMPEIKDGWPDKYQINNITFF